MCCWDGSLEGGGGIICVGFANLAVFEGFTIYFAGLGGVMVLVRVRVRAYVRVRVLLLLITCRTHSTCGVLCTASVWRSVRGYFRILAVVIAKLKYGGKKS